MVQYISINQGIEAVTSIHQIFYNRIDLNPRILKKWDGHGCQRWFTLLEKSSWNSKTHPVRELSKVNEDVLYPVSLIIKVFSLNMSKNIVFNILKHYFINFNTSFYNTSNIKKKFYFTNVCHFLEKKLIIEKTIQFLRKYFPK